MFFLRVLTVSITGPQEASENRVVFGVIRNKQNNKNFVISDN